MNVAACDAPRLGLHHNMSIQAVAYSIKTDNYRQLATASKPDIVMGHSSANCTDQPYPVRLEDI